MSPHSRIAGLLSRHLSRTSIPSPLSCALPSSSSRIPSSSGSTGWLPSGSRGLVTTAPQLRSTSFARPGPPPLPASDQAEFDELVKAAQVAPTVSPDAEAEAAAAEIDLLQHRDLRKGAAPEFEGEINPKTGEVGGPKRDPFSAGPNDWQYGGRVTDF